MRRGPLLLSASVAVVCALALLLVLWTARGEPPTDRAPVHAALPADLDLTLRLDAGTLRDAPALETLTRSSRDADEGPFVVLRDLLAERERCAESLERLAGEVAVGRRGPDWLVAVRASPLLRASAWAGRVGAPHSGIRRDVLVASSDRSLLDAALAALDAAGRSTEVVPGPGELHVDWRVPPGAPLLRGVAESGVLEVFREPMSLDGPCRLRAVIDLGHEREVAARVTLRPSGARVDPGAPGRLPSGATDVPTEPGATFLVADAWTPPRRVLDALLAWQPPGRRRLFHERLVEHGTSWDALADQLAAPLATGAAFALTRLREVDDLGLDRWDEGLVQPLPGTVVRLAWSSPTGRERFEALLEEHVDALLGDEVTDEHVLGGRLLATRRPPFDLSWSLLHPAVYLDERGVVLASHRGQLERALSADHAEPLPGTDSVPTESTSTDLTDHWRVALHGPTLARFVDDLRWEHAEVSTNRDWGRVRREIRAELAELGGFDPLERAAEEDRRVDERIDHRNEVEFPAAVVAWRRRHAWLRRIRRVEASGRIDSTAIDARVRVELR